MTPEKKNTQNSHEAETIGQRMLAAREAKGLSHAQVSAATHMMEKHIRAIESDDFPSLGAVVYAKGFIKLYSDFLGLDTEELLKEFSKKLRPKNPAQVLQTSKPSSDAKSEITEAVQQQVTKIVSVAKSLPSRVSEKALKKILLTTGVALVLAVLIGGSVIGIRSCVSVLKEKRPAPAHTTYQSDAVIDPPPEPYMDAP